MRDSEMICVIANQKAWVLTTDTKPLNFGCTVHFIEKVLECISNFGRFHSSSENLAMKI
jgi:hypothetical protein